MINASAICFALLLAVALVPKTGVHRLDPNMRRVDHSFPVQQLLQSAHFHMRCPLPVAPHPCHVRIEIVVHERSEPLAVGFDVVHGIRAQLRVALFVTKALKRRCPKEAIPIAINLSNFEPKSKHLLCEAIVATSSRRISVAVQRPKPLWLVLDADPLVKFRTPVLIMHQHRLVVHVALQDPREPPSERFLPRVFGSKDVLHQ
mmetsp:Transcript_10762/g.34231  ORF Transcript_10762/g.34231 Transcript_10762/m.34231 type:complete len:203 (-) Transcript_10762:284-892(-)